MKFTKEEMAVIAEARSIIYRKYLNSNKKDEYEVCRLLDIAYGMLLIERDAER